MDKILHKLFKAVVNGISQVLPILGEYGSEVSYLVQYNRNFADMTKFSEDINKPWLKEIIKEIKCIIKN